MIRKVFYSWKIVINQLVHTLSKHQSLFNFQNCNTVCNDYDKTNQYFADKLEDHIIVYSVVYSVYSWQTEMTSEI